MTERLVDAHYPTVPATIQARSLFVADGDGFPEVRWVVRRWPRKPLASYSYVTNAICLNVLQPVGDDDEYSDAMTNFSNIAFIASYWTWQLIHELAHWAGERHDSERDSDRWDCFLWLALFLRRKNDES